MSAATKLAIVDRLLPLLEAFGASRQQQTELRRSMKASSCTYPERMQVPENEQTERCVPCYDRLHGRTPWCEACREHDNLFARLMTERKNNKKRLQKIERLAVAYAQPEEPTEPERKELFELLHSLEQKEKESNGEAAIVRD